MIVDINIKQLGLYVVELNQLINECEETELNIFNQLKNASINWHDRNSLTFEGKIKSEKDDTFDFLLFLKKNYNIFNIILYEYKQLGNKLFINVEKKDFIINLIDDCLVQTNYALNELERVDKSFYYEELERIKKYKIKLSNAKNNLLISKEKITELFNKIKLIEDRIKSRISKLENIELNRFFFDFNG